MIEKKLNSVIPELKSEALNNKLISMYANIIKDASLLVDSHKLHEYIKLVWSYVNEVNKFFNDNKPWELFDKENELGRIWINESKYFDNVPVTAWEFFIGGYQPAQKWLKDRKERELKFEDILHYQKIIVALNETDRIMKEIDKIEIE